jgi:Fe-S-cluster containining protein
VTLPASGPVTLPAFDCRTCGACCSYAPEWPRFTLESDSAIARIPPAMVNPAGTGIRCTGDRCVGLAGTVGGTVSCNIYSVRPDVCRECMPGDEACLMARVRFGLPVAGMKTVPA